MRAKGYQLLAAGNRPKRQTTDKYVVPASWLPIHHDNPSRRVVCLFLALPAFCPNGGRLGKPRRPAVSITPINIVDTGSQGGKQRIEGAENATDYDLDTLGRSEISGA